MLYNQNSETYRTPSGSWDWKSKPLNPDSSWAGARLMDWTPKTVQFLDSAVDTCVEENTYSKNLGRQFSRDRNSSYLNMSPSGVKELIHQTYALIEQTRANQKRADEEFKIKEAQRLQHEQGIKDRAIVFLFIGV